MNIKDIYGNTALHYAVRYNYLVEVKLLIKKGADIHVKNK